MPCQHMSRCTQGFGSNRIVRSQELAFERHENGRLLKAHQDKDELIVKLKEEIDLLNRVRSRQRPHKKRTWPEAALQITVICLSNFHFPFDKYIGISFAATTI